MVIKDYKSFERKFTWSDKNSLLRSIDVDVIFNILVFIIPFAFKK